MHHQSGFLPELPAKLQILFVNRLCIFKKMVKKGIERTKKYGIWCFLCNFAGMEQNLSDYIKKNANLRQHLLKQDGGIMKFWSEHPNSDGLEALRSDYRNLCANEFREANKWSMSEDDLKWGALADDHIKKELVYMEALKNDLSSFPEVVEQVISFIEDYMDYAFRESHRNLYSDSIPPLVFYDQVISSYNLEFGMAGLCLWLVLKEHRGTAKEKKDEYDLWTEFNIRQYARIYYIGSVKLRQAIKEIIDKNTKCKTPEECRRICQKLAIDTMKRLECFALRVNGDYDRVIFYEDKEKKRPVVWSANKLAEILNVDERRIRRDNVEITKEEMEWLRVGMMYCNTSPGTTNANGLTNLQDSFRRFYHVLMDIGHFWAAQLLRHGIDMQEMEKENHTILIHQYYRLCYSYYVDRLPNDHRGDCCVYDEEEAKELLNMIKHGNNPAKEKVLMWTDRAKLCFQKAVTRKWMIFENGKYSWCGVKPKPSGKPSKSELAYFLGKVYGYKFENGNNVGARLPASELNDYFGFGKKSVTDTLLQLYRGGNEQPYMPIIDDFFNEIV